MKNLIALICQIVGLFLILAFFFSLANNLFGLHLGMKGQEVPADPRGGCFIFGDRACVGRYRVFSEQGSRRQTSRLKDLSL